MTEQKTVALLERAAKAEAALLEGFARSGMTRRDFIDTPVSEESLERWFGASTAAELESGIAGSVVYFISEVGGDRVKIGTSRHFPQRLAYLRFYGARQLRVEALIPGSFPEERRLHEVFAADRAHGEWFAWSDDLREFIDVLREGYGTPTP
jgi:hypothetical protein